MEIEKLAYPEPVMITNEFSISTFSATTSGKGDWETDEQPLG